MELLCGLPPNNRTRIISQSTGKLDMEGLKKGWCIMTGWYNRGGEQWQSSGTF